MPKYEIEAIRATASTLGKKAGHYGQLGEQIPRVDDDRAFGALQNSEHVVSGAHGALNHLNDQYSAAERHLRGISKVLASAADLLEAQESENVKALTPTGEREAQ